MYCSSDTKDIRSNMGDCINCGWHYWTEEGNMNLSNVNEVRDCIGLKPIKKLRKQYLWLKQGNP